LLCKQGIKVVDADSKRQVLELLKQEQAEKLMEVDDSAATGKSSADGSSKKKAKKRSKVKLVTKTMTGITSKRGADAAAVET
jgi:hypothetical protein